MVPGVPSPVVLLSRGVFLTCDDGRESVQVGVAPCQGLGFKSRRGQILVQASAVRMKAWTACVRGLILPVTRHGFWGKQTQASNGPVALVQLMGSGGLWVLGVHGLRGSWLWGTAKEKRRYQTLPVAALRGVGMYPHDAVPITWDRKDRRR